MGRVGRGASFLLSCFLRALTVGWFAQIIPVAYFAGLSLLPRQFRQECRATGGGKEGACAEERT